MLFPFNLSLQSEQLCPILEHWESLGIFEQTSRFTYSVSLGANKKSVQMHWPVFWSLLRNFLSVCKNIVQSSWGSPGRNSSFWDCLSQFILCMFIHLYDPQFKVNVCCFKARVASMEGLHHSPVIAIDTIYNTYNCHVTWTNSTMTALC